MRSPQPPGQFMQAHFLISPLSTTISSPALSAVDGGKDACLVTRKSNRNHPKRRNKFAKKFFMSGHHIQKGRRISPPQGY